MIRSLRTTESWITSGIISRVTAETMTNRLILELIKSEEWFRSILAPTNLARRCITDHGTKLRVVSIGHGIRSPSLSDLGGPGRSIVGSIDWSGSLLSVLGRFAWRRLELETLDQFIPMIAVAISALRSDQKEKQKKDEQGTYLLISFGGTNNPRGMLDRIFITREKKDQKRKATCRWIGRTYGTTQQ